MSTEWISVEDRLPESERLQKYAVKMLVGSISVKEVEGVVVGQRLPSRFRFNVGDWHRVTHWKEYQPPKEAGE